MSDYIKTDAKTGGKYIEDYRRLTLLYKESIGGFERYFEGLKKGVVYASRCRECSTIYYPPREICPKCKSSNVEWFTVNKRGKLLTYAEMNVKPSTHSHYEDYIVGVGEFDGVRILGLVNADFKELSVGLDIEWNVVERDPEKYPIIIFNPIK